MCPSRTDTDDGNGTLNASYEPHVKIEQKIVHEGEVNRARYQPDNQDIIATKSRSGDVYIFDRKSYSAFPKVFERFEPTLQLLGHNNEGYLYIYIYIYMENQFLPHIMYLTNLPRARTLLDMDLNGTHILRNQVTLSVPVSIIEFAIGKYTSCME